jgi:hypothetical protein
MQVPLVGPQVDHTAEPAREDAENTPAGELTCDQVESSAGASSSRALNPRINQGTCITPPAGQVTGLDRQARPLDSAAPPAEPAYYGPSEQWWWYLNPLVLLFRLAQKYE